MNNALTKARIFGIDWTPLFLATCDGPAQYAAQRKELNLFNNIAGVKRVRGCWRFSATTATAEGVARAGFHVWRSDESHDTYFAIANR